MNIVTNIILGLIGAVLLVVATLCVGFMRGGK